MNTQVLQGKWNEIAGQVREKWGQITDDELQKVRGNTDQLVGLIQRKTGQARDEIEETLESIAAGASGAVADAAERARDMAGRAAQRVQEVGENLGETARDAYEEAEDLVRRRPAESVAVVFGAGLLVGLIAALFLRGNNRPIQQATNNAEQLGRRIFDAIASVLPESMSFRS